MILKEYKEKLGNKISVWTFPNGKETFSITIHENGFVLKKRKQIIVLDFFSLLQLKDLTDRHYKKIQMLKEL